MNFLLIPILIIGSFFINKGQDDLVINFDKIDNQVKVLYGDSIVYNSDVVDYNPDLQVSVSLPAVPDPGKELKISVFNGTKETIGNDKHWEIKYSILCNGREVEYIWESADDFQEGLVFERTYIISDLISY